MQQLILKAALIAATAVVLAVPALGAETRSAASAEPVQKTPTPPKSATPKSKSSAQTKLVDINTAGKRELKRLPGVGDTEADKIIAGRPYRSKADLVTRGVLSSGVYEGLKKHVMAKPKPV